MNEFLGLNYDDYHNFHLQIFNVTEEFNKNLSEKVIFSNMCARNFIYYAITT